MDFRLQTLPLSLEFNFDYIVFTKKIAVFLELTSSLARPCRYFSLFGPVALTSYLENGAVLLLIPINAIDYVAVETL